MEEWDETTRKGSERKKQRVNPLAREPKDVVPVSDRQQSPR